MTLKVRLASMMIILLIAVMGMQYFLMQRESRELTERIEGLSREIEESTREFSRLALLGSPPGPENDPRPLLQWLEEAVGADRDTTFFSDLSESSSVHIRHVVTERAVFRADSSRAQDARLELRNFSDHDLSGHLLQHDVDESMAVEIVVAGEQFSPRRLRTKAFGDSMSPRRRVELLKINLPVPGDEEDPGRAVQLVYSWNSLTEELASARRKSWGWLAGLLGVGATGAVLVAVQFTRPIKKLESSFERVVDGDLTVQVDPERPDEVGRLTSSFNEMVGRLRETREMEARLSEAERLASLGRVSAGVAHEVRNPLNSILLTMQQMRDKSAPPEGTAAREQFDRYVEGVTSELARLEHLVGTFLDLSSSEVVERRSMDLAESVKQAVKLFEPEAASSQVELSYHGADTLIFAGDRDRLPTVWNNLIRNALQASPRGSTVEVRLEHDDLNARVTVTDQGQGFVEEDLERVFEPFYSRRADGTGLGLSLVRSIVEAHDGAVTASNRSGAGALLTVQLPNRDGDRA